MPLSSCFSISVNILIRTYLCKKRHWTDFFYLAHTYLVLLKRAKNTNVKIAKKKPLKKPYLLRCILIIVFRHKIHYNKSSVSKTVVLSTVANIVNMYVLRWDKKNEEKQTSFFFLRHIYYIYWMRADVTP